MFLLLGLLRASSSPDGSNCVLLYLLCSSGNVSGLLSAAESNQLVSVGGQAPEVTVVLVSEEDANLAWQALQKEDREEHVVVLGRRAQLQHVGQQLRRFPAAEVLHGVQQLHPLEVCHVVACQEGLLEDGVGLQRVRGGDNMHHLFQGGLVQSGGDVAEPL